MVCRWLRWAVRPAAGSGARAFGISQSVSTRRLTGEPFMGETALLRGTYDR